MNFQQLRIVRETIRCNFNLTEAASALFTSQSGVSKHIKDLEDELGVALFTRRGKRLLGLTEPGREVAEIVERMLLDSENITQVAQSFSERDQGSLRVTTTHMQARYALPPIIAKFKAAFPEVRLVLHQANPKDIAQILLDGQTDIGIATDTLASNPGILSFPYYSWDHAVVVPSGHPLASVKSVSIDDIAECPIITYDDGVTGRSRIDQAFEAAGLEPDITMSALDADVIKSYVELGLGIGIIASAAFDPQRDIGLRLLKTGALFARSTSSIAVRRGRYLRGYAYRFIELCSPNLTEDVVRAADQRQARHSAGE